MSLPNNALIKALESVRARREKSLHEYEREMDFIVSRSPELKALNDTIAMQSSKMALAAIGGNTEKAQTIEFRLIGLNKEKAALLKKLNAPAQPEYFCKECHDTGYKDGSLCRCVKDIAANISYSSLIGEMPLASSTFENFDLGLYDDKPDSDGIIPRKQMESVLGLCKRFAADFPSGENLLLTGKSGLGKTHLSLAIVNEVLKKGGLAVYGSAQNLINAVSRETFDRSGSTDAIDSLTSCDLLVLDDLGTEFQTQLSVSIVYNIVNTRLLRGLSTVISTNLSVDEISKTYSERLTSRLLGSYKVCPCFGKDIRIIKSVNL